MLNDYFKYIFYILFKKKIDKFYFKKLFKKFSNKILILLIIFFFNQLKTTLPPFEQHSSDDIIHQVGGLKKLHNCKKKLPLSFPNSFKITHLVSSSVDMPLSKNMRIKPL